MIANGIVLLAYAQYRQAYAIGSVAAEIATVANRIALPLAGYAAAGEAGPARDLLAVFAAFPYIVCADFLTGGAAPAASWPVIGCARIKRAGEEVRIEVPAAGRPAQLVVRYDRGAVLADLQREFLILGGLALIGGLAILLPAVIAFRWTINRPLGQMLAAIALFEQHDRTARVDHRSEDEIGRVVHSYNSMLDREVERSAEIQEAHRAIVESVSYASRIQRGLLPPAERLATGFAECAVLWEPRDVVGGDIYWVSLAGPRPTVVLLDCTGHGVPGGFMTMVAVATLERVFGAADDLGPAAILARLNALTRSLLNQDVARPTSNDGMDAAVCQIDATTRTAIFAGAHLSLLVAQGERVTRVRGDRSSVGYADSPADLRVRETRVPLDSATRLFLASDGVTDQPGGARRTAFGHQRLMRSIAQHRDGSLEQVLAGVKADLNAYAGRETRRDDATIVALAPRLS
jgi:serine phosphatase RsbU (regulator of sigma subunit)